MKTKIDLDEKFEYGDDPKFHNQIIADMQTAILFGISSAFLLIYITIVFYKWIES